MKIQIEIQQTIDTCGTRCPIPLLRAKQALKGLQVGEYLKVLATDPSAKPDFDAMLRHLPHALIEYTKSEFDSGEHLWLYSFVIQKG